MKYIIQSSKMLRVVIVALLFLVNFVNSSSNPFGDNLIGDPCSLDSDCVGNPDPGNSECDATSKCICKNGFVASTLKDTCLEVANDGPCIEPQQCQEGLPGEFSDCLMDQELGEKVCTCTDQAIPVVVGLGLRCLKKADVIGDACETSEQCTSNLGSLSECSHEGKCFCKPESLESDSGDKCLPKGVVIGKPCELDEQCVGEPGTSSGCRSGICVCSVGFISSSNSDDCLQIRNTEGDSCKEIQQCQMGQMGNLSNCTGPDPNNKVCACLPEAISSPGDNTCRRKATHVGDSCATEAQCLSLEYSQCTLGTCTCRGETVESADKTKCLSKLYIDDLCEDKNQCSWITGSICEFKNVSDPSTDKICRCGPDFVNPAFFNHVCYPKAQFIGRPCDQHPIQCIDLDDSQCLNDGKICACHEPTQVVSGDRKRCLPKVTGLNASCTESPQCSNPNTECLTTNTEPIEKECKCLRNEYVEGWEPNGRCLKVANEIRLPCEETHQCTTGLGSLSECRDGLCLCKPGYNYFEGRCYLPAPLNGRCNSDGECKAGVNNYTLCDNFYCRCVQGAFDYGNLCYDRKVVGDSCNTDIECTVNIGGNVGCDRINKKCFCQYGHVTALENTLCVSSSFRFETRMEIFSMLAIVAAFVQKLF